MSDVIGGDSLIQAYTALRNAGAVDQALERQLNTAVLCLVGQQSSGKTSFLETIVGFPVGFTARSTGTRCPVRYILRNAEAEADPSYKVGGKPVGKPEDIRERVKDHMMALTKKADVAESFSQETLAVEIHKSGMMDLDLIDLPGLQDKRAPDCQKIVDIVSPFLRDPLVIPVVMCKAQANHETQLDMDLLQDIGLQLDKALVVLNFFNQQITDMHKVSVLNKYCKDYMHKFRQVRFVCLQTAKPVDRDSMSFSELSQYYSSLPSEEESFVDDQIAHMDSDQPLDQKATEAMGLRSAHKFLEGLLNDWVKTNGVRALQVLKQRLDELEAQKEKVGKLLKDRDPKAFASLLRAYVTDYERIMAALHTAEQTHIQDLCPTSLYGPGYDWAFTMDDMDIATTFEDEQSWVQDRDPPVGWKDFETLARELGGTHTGEILYLRLHTHAALERLLLVVGYCIVTFPDRQYTKEEILSKGGRANGGMMHSFSKHKVMKQLITERLMGLQAIVQEACIRIQALYAAPLKKLREVMQRSHPVVASCNHFVTKLDDKFKAMLHANTETAAADLHSLIMEMTRFVQVDAMTRWIAVVAQAPIRKDILRADPERGFLEEMEGGAIDNKDGANADHHTAPGRLEQLASDVLQVVPGPLQAIGRSVLRNLRRNPDVLERKPNESVPPRVAERREALIRTKKALYSHAHLFAPIDVVEAGLQEFPPEDYQSINVEEFNKDAKQYAWLLKCQIASMVEVKLNRYVFEPFYHNQLLSEITQEMLNFVDELATSTACEGGKTELEQMMNCTNLHEHRRHAEALEQQSAAIRTAARELRKALSMPEPAPASWKGSTDGVTVLLPGMDKPLPSFDKRYFLTHCCPFDFADILSLKKAHVRVELVENLCGRPMLLSLSFLSGAMVGRWKVEKQLRAGGVLPRAARHYCHCVNLDAPPERVGAFHIKEAFIATSSAGDPDALASSLGGGTHGQQLPPSEALVGEQVGDPHAGSAPQPEARAEAKAKATAAPLAGAPPTKEQAPSPATPPVAGSPAAAEAHAAGGPK